MKGKLLGIELGASGNDILTILIKLEGGGHQFVESRGFINGRNGVFVAQGETIEFDLKYNNLSACHYAKNIKAGV